jgi:hypothetical protein
VNCPAAHWTVEKVVDVAITTHVCAYVLETDIHDIAKPLGEWSASQDSHDNIENRSNPSLPMWFSIHIGMTTYLGQHATAVSPGNMEYSIPQCASVDPPAVASAAVV